MCDESPVRFRSCRQNECNQNISHTIYLFNVINELDAIDANIHTVTDKLKHEHV